MPVADYVARTSWGGTAQFLQKQPFSRQNLPCVEFGQKVLLKIVYCLVEDSYVTPAQHINFGHLYFPQTITPNHQNGVPKMNFPEFRSGVCGNSTENRNFFGISWPIPIWDFEVLIFSVLGEVKLICVYWPNFPQGGGKNRWKSTKMVLNVFLPKRWGKTTPKGRISFGNTAHLKMITYIYFRSGQDL